MMPAIVLGGVTLSTYWLMFAAGLAGMAALMVRSRGRYGLSAGKAAAFALVLAVCGLLGTKVLYVLENWRETLENGLTLGGQSFFGAVFLIPPLMGAAGLLFGLAPGRSLDACAPCVAVMIACMRVGCFFNGCCGGWEMTLGGLRFRWPTQAMEGAGDFLLLGLLLQMEGRDAFPRRRYAVFMAGYGVLRFFVEFLRDTPKDWLGFGHGQWFARLSILIGGALLLPEKRKRKGTRQ